MKTDKETCLEVIHKFHEQISWADETNILPLSEEIGLVMVCSASVYFPVHWSDFEALKENTDIWQVASNLNLVPTFLIFGNPDEPTTERIIRAGMEIERIIAGEPTFLHVSFIDVEARITWSQFVNRALDGIDWQRSIEAVSRDGTDAKPVWQWDD